VDLVRAVGGAYSAPIHTDTGVLHLDARGLTLSSTCGREEEDGCDHGDGWKDADAEIMTVGLQPS